MVVRLESLVELLLLLGCKSADPTGGPARGFKTYVSGGEVRGGTMGPEHDVKGAGRGSTCCVAVF